MDKKRKDQPHQEPNPDELDEERLGLTLAPPSRRPRQSLLSQQPPSSFLSLTPENPPCPLRTPGNPTQDPCADIEIYIPPPFPWATDCRASVRSLESLLAAGIRTISGEVFCLRCEGQDVVELDLQEKYAELWLFIDSNKMLMHNRAPKQWMSPKLMDCRICKQLNAVCPLVSTKKREINWLFLLLSQTLGCCTVDQLQYFCKHTGNRRSGAKDSVLYFTYLGLCEQLDPSKPFRSLKKNC